MSTLEITGAAETAPGLSLRERAVQAAAAFRVERDREDAERRAQAQADRRDLLTRLLDRTLGAAPDGWTEGGNALVDGIEFGARPPRYSSHGTTPAALYVLTNCPRCRCRTSTNDFDDLVTFGWLLEAGFPPYGGHECELPADEADETPRPAPPVRLPPLGEQLEAALREIIRHEIECHAEEGG